jgi:hypothetical protein
MFQLFMSSFRTFPDVLLRGNLNPHLTIFHASSKEALVSALQDRIVELLTNSFILDRAIDPAQVARVLRAEFIEMDIPEIRRTVVHVATVIGVRLKEKTYEIPKAVHCPCV